MLEGHLDPTQIQLRRAQRGQSVKRAVEEFLWFGLRDGLMEAVKE